MDFGKYWRVVDIEYWENTYIQREDNSYRGDLTISCYFVSYHKHIMAGEIENHQFIKLRDIVSHLKQIPHKKRNYINVGKLQKQMLEDKLKQDDK